MKQSATISDRKLELAQWLLAIDDEALLAQIEALMQTTTGQPDWWDELSEEEKAEVKEAEADLAAGRVFSHEEVMEKLKSCLRP